MKSIEHLGRRKRSLVIAAVLLTMGILFLLTLVFLEAAVLDWLAIVVISGALVSSVLALVFLAPSVLSRDTERLEREKKIAELIPTVSAVASHFVSSVAEIRAMADKQREGAIQQTAAVSETRAALRSTAEAAKTIASSAEVVQTNAEATLESNRRGSELIKSVAEQAERVEQTVDLIKSIASKSELLALNASLEGTKAGVVGKGFSLVAAQMQRLSETIAASLKEIEELTHGMSSATSSTEETLYSATIRAQETADAGREITAHSYQQSTATVQVVSSMDEISAITDRVATDSMATSRAAETLHSLSQNLVRIVEELEAQ